MFPESITNHHLHILDYIPKITTSFSEKCAEIPLLLVSIFFKICYNEFIRGALFLWTHIFLSESGRHWIGRAFQLDLILVFPEGWQSEADYRLFIIQWYRNLFQQPHLFICNFRNKGMVLYINKIYGFQDFKAAEFHTILFIEPSWEHPCLAGNRKRQFIFSFDIHVHGKIWFRFSLFK